MKHKVKKQVLKPFCRKEEKLGREWEGIADEYLERSRWPHIQHTVLVDLKNTDYTRVIFPSTLLSSKYLFFWYLVGAQDRGTHLKNKGISLVL